MSSSFRQLYLASLWQYSPAGVQHIVDVMAARGFEKAEFLYEAEWNLFKVTCLEGDVAAIIDTFNMAEEKLELELIEVDDIDQILNPELAIDEDASNSYISRVYGRSNSEQATADFEKFRCPPNFHKFEYTRVWDELDHETITAQALLDHVRLQDLAQLAHVQLSYDLAGKTLYIGGTTLPLVEDAVRRLTVLLKQMIRPPPKTLHILYGEHYTDFTVDARLMRSISAQLLRTTVLDPRLFSLPEQYAQLAEGGVALRICPIERPSRPATSLFGPASQNLHRGSALSRCSGDFANWVYAPKRKVMPLPLSSPPASSLTRADPRPFSRSSLPSDPGDEAAHSDTRGSFDLLSSWPSPALLSFETKAMPQAEQSSSQDAISSKLIDDSNPASHNITFDMAPLVPSSPSPLKARPDHRSKASSAGPQEKKAGEATPKGSPGLILPKMQLGAKAGDLKSEFVNRLTGALGELAEYGRGVAGRLSFRVEFGRICTWGWDASALATNKEGQPSNGYNQADLLDVLHTKLLRRGGILFSKILSLHGNDAEYLTTQTVPGVIKCRWDRSSSRVVYEFACETPGKNQDVDQAHGFVVEVDGSSPNNFHWSLRNDQDELGKIYIHGIWRNWDLRVVLAGGGEQELKTYGHFAEALNASILVRSAPRPHPTCANGKSLTEGRLAFRENTTGQPQLEFEVNPSYGVAVRHLRVRHIVRYRSSDGQAVLDVTRMQDMAIKEIQPPSGADPSVGITLFRAATVKEKQRRGIFGSWYEAAISSTRAEELFLQNEELTLGMEANWTTEQMMADGVFHSLCSSSLEMLKSMDSIGHNNNNTIDGPDAQPVTPSSASSATGVSYW